MVPLRCRYSAENRYHDKEYPHEFENGWYGGQIDDPKGQKDYLNKYGIDKVLFDIRPSQFQVSWQVLVPEEVRDLAEVLLLADSNSFVTFVDHENENKRIVLFDKTVDECGRNNISAEDSHEFLLFVGTSKPIRVDISDIQRSSRFDPVTDHTRTLARVIKIAISDEDVEEFAYLEDLLGDLVRVTDNFDIENDGSLDHRNLDLSVVQQLQFEVLGDQRNITVKEDPKDALARGLKSASVQQAAISAEQRGDGIIASSIGADGQATTKVISGQDFIDGKAFK
jgi:hypothetical protein